jgi:putative ATP-dependent endonuclease of the OLD family
VTTQSGTSGSLPTPDFAAVYVERVRVRNYRGVVDCVVELEPDLTLLVGRNNAGKSRFLRALAIGLGAEPADRDDLTVGGEGEATVDIILAPRPALGEGEFFTDRIGQRIGELVQNIADDPPRERFAWRTTIRPSNEGLGVRAESAVLTFDATIQDWILTSQPTTQFGRQRSIVAADLVQPRRDLADELLRRGSPIRRVLDDLEVPDKKRGEIESRLAGLGTDIVEASSSLAAVKSALDVLTRSIDEIGSPRLEPLPIRLEELARAVSINLTTGGVDLPLRFHGSGARSLASLQVQSVLYDRRLGRDGTAILPHPVSLIEEPEAHLHPQAQFELDGLLTNVRGQVVASTHSAHLVSVVEPRSIRQLHREPRGIRIVDFKPAATDGAASVRARKPSMHADEMEKLRRMVERPFGELMFASAIVVGDGATERALLPPLIRHVLPGRAHGVCVVDPGSMLTPDAIAVVKFASLVGVPWFLFADSDSDGRAAASTLAGGDASGMVWVPAKVTDGDNKGAATERMLHDFDAELCERACQQIGHRPGEDLLRFMTKKKGVVGRLIALELIDSAPDPLPVGQPLGHLPAAIGELIQKLDAVLPVHLAPVAPMPRPGT